MTGIHMPQKQILDDLSQKIMGLLPRVNGMSDDIRLALQELLQKGFRELNILTREEFEGSRQALERAEQRVELLEQQLLALEKKLAQLAPSEAQRLSD